MPESILMVNLPEMPSYTFTRIPKFQLQKRAHGDKHRHMYFHLFHSRYIPAQSTVPVDCP